MYIVLDVEQRERERDIYIYISYKKIVIESIICASRFVCVCLHMCVESEIQSPIENAAHVSKKKTTDQHLACGKFLPEFQKAVADWGHK